MDRDDLIKNLTKLVQLDLDAVESYNQAIEKADVDEVRAALSRFRDDHQQHIADLSASINQLGGEPPCQADLKGLLLEGITALRSATGTAGALKAMRMNEKLTNKTYDEALQWDVPADIRAIIEKNYNDEQSHLRFIEQAIENEIWNASSVSHA